MLPLLVLVGAVALDVDAPVLRGRLALLLVDEGIDVYGPDSGATKTRVTARGDTYELTMDVDPPVRVRVESAVPAVAELELAQRIVLSTKGPSDEKIRNPLIRLDVRGDVPMKVRARAAARLLGSSFGLTSDPRRATEGRCLSVVAGRARLERGPPNEPCAVPPKVVPPPPPPVVAEKPPVVRTTPPVPPPPPPTTVTPTVAVARSEPPPPPEPGNRIREPEPDPPAPPPVSTTTTTAPRIETAPKSGTPDAAWTFRVSAAGGATARAHGTDPCAAVDIELKPSWFGVRASGLFIDGGGSDVRVWELVVSGGPTATVFRSGDWSIDVAVLVGAHRHGYTFGDEASGERWDLAVDAPAALYWTPTDPITVGLLLRPGIDSRARQHTQDGEILWERGAFRMTAGLSLGVEFGR